jgi:hypothetical protein
MQVDTLAQTYRLVVSDARAQAMGAAAGGSQRALVVLTVFLVHRVAFGAASYSAVGEWVPTALAELVSLCDRCSPEMQPRYARLYLAALAIGLGRYRGGSALNAECWHGTSRADGGVLVGRRRTCCARAAHAARSQPIRHRHAVRERAATKTDRTLFQQRA